jgi:coenzyme PQQ synthesis protein D (PqqD)
MTETSNLSLLDVKITVPRYVVHRAFAGEMVVLDLRTGRYHGLNPTGGRIFELISKSATVREAAEALATEYERPLDELEQHVCDFCAALLEQGLVETNGSVPR